MDDIRHNNHRVKYHLDETPEASPWKIIRSFPIIDKVKLAKALLRTTLDPEHTAGIFQILDLFIKHEKRLGGGISKLIERVASDPSLADFVKSRYIPEPTNLEDLAPLPEGTLGKAFETHMRTNNLDVQFFPKVEITSDLTWMEMRGRQTHDMFHTVTGFGTSVVDELGLMAFVLGQLESPLASGIIGGGLMHAVFFCPWEIHNMLDAITNGYRMGCNADIILGYRFEDNWETPIEKVRSDLNIQVA
jgi:ubiquinone biosynthesis protein Coq4